MSRDIDRVIQYVRTLEGFSPVHKLVLELRLDYPPTEDELAFASRELERRRREVTDGK